MPEVSKKTKSNWFMVVKLVKSNGETPHWFQVLFHHDPNQRTCGTTKGLLRRSSVCASAGRSRCNLVTLGNWRDLEVDLLIFATQIWHMKSHKKSGEICDATRNYKYHNCNQVQLNLKHAILKHATPLTHSTLYFTQINLDIWQIKSQLM